MLIEIVIRINSENRLTTIIGGRTVELQCRVILCHLDWCRSATESDKGLIEKDKALHEEIVQRGRAFGAMVRFVDLITVFCSVCFVNSLDEAHKIKDTIGGEIFRAFSCGRRGQKTELLRYDLEEKGCSGW